MLANLKDLERLSMTSPSEKSNKTSNWTEPSKNQSRLYQNSASSTPISRIRRDVSKMQNILHAPKRIELNKPVKNLGVQKSKEEVKKPELKKVILDNLKNQKEKNINESQVSQMSQCSGNLRFNESDANLNCDLEQPQVPIRKRRSSMYGVSQNKELGIRNEIVESKREKTCDILESLVKESHQQVEYLKLDRRKSRNSWRGFVQSVDLRENLELNNEKTPKGES